MSRTAIKKGRNGSIPSGKASQQKEKRKLGRMDITLFFLIIVLLSFGLVMVFSASYATSLKEKQSSFAIVQKQTICVGIGLVLMLFASYIDYHLFRKFQWLLYVVSLALMAYAWTIPHKSGANRWFYIGSISVQPSEIMKFSMIVVFSSLIAVNYKRMNKLRYGLVPFGLILLPIVILMAMQRHLSGLLIMVTLGLIMAFVGGGKLLWYIIAGVGGVAGAGAYVIYKGFDYIQKRLATWLNPFENIRNDGWQISQSLYAIGSGGLFGVGLGNSTQKFLYISEPQNDFIFAIVCEEFGFFGALLVILLFVFFVYEGLSIAMRAPDKFGAMMAIGLTLQIGLQAVLNIAVVTNSIPTTGVSLPFFSAGGTATIMQLAQMGVLLNISRQSIQE